MAKSGGDNTGYWSVLLAVAAVLGGIVWLVQNYWLILLVLLAVGGSGFAVYYYHRKKKQAAAEAEKAAAEQAYLEDCERQEAARRKQQAEAAAATQAKIAVELQQVQDATRLKPITPPKEILVKDEFYFERKNVALVTTVLFGEAHTVVGTLFLTSRELIFMTDDRIRKYPYRIFDYLDCVNYESTSAQVTIKVGDRFIFLIPQASAQLMSAYFEKLFTMSDSRELLEKLAVPLSNKCPNCGAYLKDGFCEYCRWQAPQR